MDESPTLAQRFQVEGVPTLLFFNGGKVVGTMTGLPSSQELEAQLVTLGSNHGK